MSFRCRTGILGMRAWARWLILATLRLKRGNLVLTAPNIWKSKVFAGYQMIEEQFLLKLPKDVPPAHLLMAQQLGTVVFGAPQAAAAIGQDGRRAWPGFGRAVP